jgi:capsule biosynthesis phosphatase
MNEPSNYADTIYVDLDGTLCPIKREGEHYADLPVNAPLVARLRRAREQGFQIVVYTARNVRTHAGDMSRLTAITVPAVLAWLDKNAVPYDGLIVGKPWPGPRGFYVDDKAVRPDEFAKMSDAEIQALIGNAQ